MLRKERSHSVYDSVNLNMLHRHGNLLEPWGKFLTCVRLYTGCARGVLESYKRQALVPVSSYARVSIRNKKLVREKPQLCAANILGSVNPQLDTLKRAWLVGNGERELLRHKINKACKREIALDLDPGRPRRLVRERKRRQKR